MPRLAAKYAAAASGESTSMLRSCAHRIDPARTRASAQRRRKSRTPEGYQLMHLHQDVGDERDGDHHQDDDRHGVGSPRSTRRPLLDDHFAADELVVIVWRN